MNSIISLSLLRPVFSSSFLKKTIYVGPVLPKSLLSQNVIRKPRMSCVGQTLEISFTPKRYFTEWIKKNAMKMPSGSKIHHNHGQMWLTERLISIGTLTSFLAMFIHPCENGELFFSVMVASHVHFGIEAIMIDYLRPVVVGNAIPKLIPIFTFAISGTFIALLMWVAVKGNGIAGSLQQIWYLDPLREPYDIDDSKLKFPDDSKYHLAPK